MDIQEQKGILIKQGETHSARYSGCSFVSFDKACFDDACFHSCDFNDIVIRETTFKNCAFYDTQMRALRFVDCVFENCLFSQTDLTLCSFENCQGVPCQDILLRDCNLDQCNGIPVVSYTNDDGDCLCYNPTADTVNYTVDGVLVSETLDVFSVFAQKEKDRGEEKYSNAYNHFVSEVRAETLTQQATVTTDKIEQYTPWDCATQLVDDIDLIARENDDALWGWKLKRAYKQDGKALDAEILKAIRVWARKNNLL